jgi:hypothetical protein
MNDTEAKNVAEYRDLAGAFKCSILNLLKRDDLITMKHSDIQTGDSAGGAGGAEG